MLNVAGNHWITVSNIWCQPGEVNIYDSIRSRVVSTRTRDQIAAILFSQRQKITLTISAVQEQRGSSDCGLFALAYATSLCSGEHPAQVNYVQHMFRNHLLTCLQRRQITPFPSTTRPRKLLKSYAQVSYNIFCICRLPEDGRMVQCDQCMEWFHEQCVTIPLHIWSEAAQSQWCCSECSIDIE